ncbi:GntR family transcriptional regulator [Pseudovibrio exalbescens]|uniref:GntR family transcriptional regulator n=1 Tax=Pseudovibrio exalbescens TaxID=197461 RepID=A0A1U7JEE5_9HYPH|nr:GntR family transcriptional regulator [Pseudovibrio exalbescens]OKL43075.1 GntR family transcriptional regulator [Pseudovibrio exalbescens]
MAIDHLLAEHARESLADKAYRLIEELIVNLDLSPGMVLTESDLCERTEIGRTPVREAIKRLSTEGLIVIRPRKGLFVSEVEPAEYVLMLETRKPLEQLMVASAVKRATAQEREALAECAEEILKQARAEDVKGYLRADKIFDEVLCAVSRNPYTARACAPLQTMSRRAWSAFRGAEKLEDSAILHRDVAVALANNDADKAQEAITQLMDHLTHFAVEQAEQHEQIALAR